MAQIQISVSNTTGGSSSANGTITDPDIIAKAREIMDALTTDAVADPPAADQP